MKKLLHEMARLVQQGESFVVATIFNKTGSAPRTVGAKMVVRSDGSIIGTIGGGRLEAGIIKLASSVMLSGKSVIQQFSLTGEDVAEMDMVCGGQGEVLLDFVDASDESNRITYAEAAAISERRGKAWLITKLEIDSDAGRQSRQQCLVKVDGTPVGRFDADPKFLARLTTGPAKISIHTEVIDNRRIFVEPIRNSETVYIFGAGHVSQKIAPLSETVGFRTVVLDDRPDYANRDKFRAPMKIVLLQSFEHLPDLDIDEDSYVVIVTRGHLHDKTVLEQALKTRAGYIGMIGSRRKRDKIYEALASHGFGSSNFDRVYSPIGTDIGAETPEELAVSIVGELIKVRAEKEKCL